MWGAGHGAKGVFDIANRYAGLDAKNDPLARIEAAVPWAALPPRLETVRCKPAADRAEEPLGLTQSDP